MTGGIFKEHERNALLRSAHAWCIIEDQQNQVIVAGFIRIVVSWINLFVNCIFNVFFWQKEREFFFVIRYSGTFAYRI